MTPFNLNDNGILRQVLLNGKRVVYDAMSSNHSLEQAKAFYSNYDYMGSSNEYFINGVSQTIKGELPIEECHFFKHK